MSRRSNRPPPILRAAVHNEPTAFEERRKAAGTRIAANPENFRHTEGGIAVRSESHPQHYYECIATEDSYWCECADHNRNGSKCKHIYAGELYLYGRFLPEPELPLAFERLGDRIVSVLERYARDPMGEELYRQLIGEIRTFQRKQRDLLHLVLYIERGMINRSYVSDVLADFAMGEATLEEIRHEYSLG